MIACSQAYKRLPPRPCLQRGLTVFVMLGHVHLPDDGPKFYLDLNIHDFNRLCLKPIKYFKQLAWRVSGVLGDILLLPDSSTVGDEEKLCN